MRDLAGWQRRMISALLAADDPQARALQDIDHLFREIGRLEGLIEQLRQLVHESQWSEPPTIEPGSGTVWAAGKDDGSMTHLVPCHIEVLPAPWMPVPAGWPESTYEVIVVDDVRSACGVRTIRNPYHGHRLWGGAWDCCPDCLKTSSDIS